LIRREDLSGDEAAPALAPLLRSLGFEKVTVVFEQPPATASEALPLATFDRDQRRYGIATRDP